MQIKQKLIAVAGAISAGIGAIGALIASLGLCACVLAPTLSLIGIVSILVAFLTRWNYLFLSLGIILIAVSVTIHFYHLKQTTCPVRQKRAAKKLSKKTTKRTTKQTKSSSKRHSK